MTYDDARLVARAAERLLEGGLEVHQLRVDLVLALLAAANLAGNRSEAAELRAVLHQLSLGNPNPPARS